MGEEQRVGVCVTVEGEEAARKSRGSPGGDGDLGSCSAEAPGLVFIAAATEAAKVCSSCRLGERRAAVWLSRPPARFPSFAVISKRCVSRVRAGRLL